MKANEILPILQDWHDRVKELEEKMRAFYGVVGCVPESPFSTAVYGLIGSYTESVAQRIDWDASVLKEWCWSHDFGEKPMRMGLPHEPIRVIDTIEDLAKFIADDKAWAIGWPKTAYPAK
jgi:hypothetical protein